MTDILGLLAGYAIALGSIYAHHLWRERRELRRFRAELDFIDFIVKHGRRPE